MSKYQKVMIENFLFILERDQHSSTMNEINSGEMDLEELMDAFRKTNPHQFFEIVMGVGPDDDLSLEDQLASYMRCVKNGNYPDAIIPAGNILKKISERNKANEWN